MLPGSGTTATRKPTSLPSYVGYWQPQSHEAREHWTLPLNDPPRSSRQVPLIAASSHSATSPAISYVPYALGESAKAPTGVRMFVGSV